MKILLDTHILLWWLAGDKRLSQSSIQQIENPQYQIFISVVSFWEMAIKIEKGKLRVDLEMVISEVQNCHFTKLAILEEHVLNLQKLPNHHNDPFDRMLAAQAITEPLHLITHDKNLAQYSQLVILV